MGQKINANILRIGKIKEWKSKYIEKKTPESSIVIFQNLEITTFISQLFTKHGLKIENCRIYSSESSLHIYISYYNSIKPSILNEKIRLQGKNMPSKSFQKKIVNIRQRVAKKQLYTTKVYKKTFKNRAKIVLFQNYYLLNKKTHRLNMVNSFKTYADKKYSKTLNQQNASLFVSKILKGLNLFTNKKHNIFLNLKQINKETSLLQTMSKKNKHKLNKNIIKLRKYQKSEFFKKGLNILDNFMQNPRSPSFLAKFIAFYLKKLKRPNFFLRFLKLALKTLRTRKLSQLKRIQIKIKGRFNGAPRSTHKFINIGKNIPVLTLNSNINYGESTAYTSNGSFGIKIWTYTVN